MNDLGFDRRGQDHHPGEVPWRKDVFVIVDKGENRKSFWHKIGVAFVNKDGSLSVHLDSLPMTGKLQIRDHVERSDNQGGGGNWP
jgi:hypothetical protein